MQSEEEITNKIQSKRKIKKTKSFSIFGDESDHKSFIYKGKVSNIFVDQSSRENFGIRESKFMQLPNVSIIEGNKNRNPDFLNYSSKEEESFLNKLDIIYSKEKNSEKKKHFYDENFFFEELNNIDDISNKQKKQKTLSKINPGLLHKDFHIKQTKSYKKEDIKDKGFGVFFE